MSLYVLDTDCLSLWQYGHPEISSRIAAISPDELAITVITVQEQLDGWHSRLSRVSNNEQLSNLYQRLSTTVAFLARLRILPYSESAIAYYEDLVKQKLNVGKMDLRIASIVLDFGATLITRNSRDFSRISGVVVEDWTI
jgi:tRNA(fMet)-specific endonuclease VapC